MYSQSGVDNYLIIDQTMRHDNNNYFYTHFMGSLRQTVPFTDYVL